MNELPKVTFYALHMNFGGVEASIAQTANMLVDNYQVEIVVFYNFGMIPFDLDPRIKIKYLTNLTPNRQQLKLALKGRANLIKELAQAIKIWYWRRESVKQHIKQNTADILISSRILYHDLIGKYSHSRQVTICQEHVDHKNNARYIRKLVHAIRKCDYLMPVSQFLADDYSKVSPIAVKYIPHAVKTLKKCSYKPSKRLISVGRLSEEKGFMDLIKMMKILHQFDKEFCLDIYGDGEERAALEDQIFELDLKSVVRLRGFQPPEIVSKAMSESGIYVMTSFEESFGLVLIEAMSHGLPVVAFNSARGAKEIISQGGGILISERNLMEMARSVVSLTNDQLNQFSQKALSVAREYDYQVIKQQWLDFLRTVKRSKNVIK